MRMENLLDKFLSFANTSYSMFDVKSKVKKVLGGEETL